MLRDAVGQLDKATPERVASLLRHPWPMKFDDLISLGQSHRLPQERELAAVERHARRRAAANELPPYSITRGKHANYH